MKYLVTMVNHLKTKIDIGFQTENKIFTNSSDDKSFLYKLSLKFLVIYCILIIFKKNIKKNIITLTESQVICHKTK